MTVETKRSISISPPVEVGSEVFMALCRGVADDDVISVRMPLIRVQDVCGVLFADSKRRIYVHSLKEILLCLLRYRVTPPAEMFLDVSLAAYLMEPPEPDRREDWRKFQLSSLVRRYLTEPYPLIFKRIEVSDYPEAVYIWRLGPILVLKIIEDETLLQPYWELEIMLAPVLAEMEYRGVELDAKRIGRARPIIQRALHALGRQMVALYGRPFTPWSSDDVRAFLSSTCGVGP